MPLSFRHHFVAALSLGAAALAVSSASAGTSSDTLTVRVAVQNSCSVGGTTIDFGTYSSGQQAALDGQGDITFTNCPAGTLSVSLDGGGSNNISDRRMSGENSATLRYQLFRNSARNQVWGIGVDGLQQVLLVPGSGTIPVFGRILGGQTVSSGAYSDTVNITMTF